MKLFRIISLLALGATLLLPNAARAQNSDGDFAGVPGTPAFLTEDEGEHPSIRLLSEKIVCTLRPNDLYETDAQFVFSNDSARAVTVKMGFPEYNNPIPRATDPSAFKKFAATLRGKPLAVRRENLESLDYNFVSLWRVANVRFAPRERVRVGFAALSPAYFHGQYGYKRLLSYKFLGQSWKGKVERTDVEVRVPMAGHWVSLFGLYEADFDGDPWYAPAVESKNGVGYFRKTWRNWSGEASGQWSLQRTLPDWLIDPDAKDTLTWEPNLPHFSSLQVGAGIGRVDAPAPQSYQSQGVRMVSLAYLARAVAASNQKIGLSYDAATRAATLQMGTIKTSFAPGQKMMRVQRGSASETVALPVAPQLINVAGKSSLYVPLEAATAALGLEVSMNKLLHTMVITAPEVAAPTPISWPR